MRDVHDYDETPAPAVSTERYEAVATDPYARRRDIGNKAVGLISLIFGIIEGLLAIRFILLALGANPNAGFASLVNGLTDPLMIPFTGLFQPLSLNGGVLDWNVLTAILAYGLLGWVLAKLVWLIVGETRSEVYTHSRRVDTDLR